MPTIISYVIDNQPQYGLLIDGVIHAWTGDPFTSDNFTPGPAIGTPDHVQLCPPVQPSKIVCIGRNYAAHAAEHQAEVPGEPMIFFKPPSALIAPGEPIEIPSGIGRVDHEAELAVIIKRPARRVSAQDALSYVLGYTCANDVSARVLQQKDDQWGRAKGFDTFCPLGPWITTGLDPRDVQVIGRVNGDIRQQDRTSNMVFDVPTLIAFISGIMTLLPGDVILTGTPAGVSELFDGDAVDIEIEGIGILRNPVCVIQ